MSLLEVRGLAVHYATGAGALRAVDGADFDVPAGAILGLLTDTLIRSIERVALRWQPGR